MWSSRGQPRSLAAFSPLPCSLKDKAEEREPGNDVDVYYSQEIFHRNRIYSDDNKPRVS